MSEEGGSPGTAGEMARKKEAPKIKLVLQGSQDNKMTVVVKKSTKVGKLLGAYCDARGVNRGDFRVICCGQMMKEDDEIGSYSLHDGDVVEVVAAQVGGCL